MSEKKHIDRLFQEKFKDFETQPPASVWEGIRSELATPTKKDRKVIPLWWRVAGIAALLALLFTAVNFWGPETTTDELVDSDSDQIENTTDGLIKTDPETTNDTEDQLATQDSEDQEDNSSNDALIIADQKDQSEGVANTNSDNSTQNKKTNYIVNKSVVNDLIKTNTDDIIKETTNSADAVVANQQETKTEGVTNNATEINTDAAEGLINKEAITESLENNTNDAVGVVTNNDASTKAMDANKEAANKEQEVEDGKIDLNEYIANKEEEEAIAKEEALLKQQEFDGKRWSVAPQVAPVFYGSLSEGSSIGSEFADNAKSSETNFSYGVQVSYNVNDRFSIRSGVNLVNLGYNTNDIEFAVTPEDVALSSGSKFVNGSISYVVGDKGTLENRYSAAVPTTEDSPPATIDAFQGQLNQRLEYLEVPVEMSYALINKRFRLNLVGGFSSLILQDNQLVAISGAREAALGSSENLNAFSFTTNVGLGLNYNITDQFRVSMEPMFKYQLNPYSDASVDFKPYYMGVYTGLSFRF